MLVLVMFSCQNEPEYNPNFLHGKDVSFLIHDWNTLINNIMVGDGFSPLLAGRSFAYPNVAAYEVLTHGYDQPSIAAKLNGLGSLPQPDSTKKYCYELAAVQAFATVAKVMVYRPFFCDTMLSKNLTYFRDSLKLSPEVINNSTAFGDSVAMAILAWASKDQYKETKAQPKYLFSTEPGHWIPTPPEYKPALEPYWKNLRTFSGLDPKEHEVPFTLEYNMDKGSGFYNLVMEVYDTSMSLTPEQTEIAKYWDDNPNQMTFSGHIPTTRRHMSPTAHWMSITRQACEVKDLDIMQSAYAYAAVSMAISDANICVWNQKYITDLIRPVTVIQKFINEDWMPLIVTPPFPEHTSGHSAISASAATVLTGIIGDNYAFLDTTVSKYGYPPRSFKSFNAAALEASWSRVFGGIHYSTGILGGQKQGQEAGAIVLDLFKEE